MIKAAICQALLLAGALATPALVEIQTLTKENEFDDKLEGQVDIQVRYVPESLVL